MSGRYWTTREVADMRRWYGVLSVSEIADRLGRSRPAIWNMAQQLGLSGKRFVGAWTYSDIANLKQWYGSVPIEQISERLGKSPDAIYSRAYRMGLSRRIDYPDVEETKGLIREGWSQTRIAKHLGITPQSLSGRLRAPVYDEQDREQARKNWRIKQTSEPDNRAHRRG